MERITAYRTSDGEVYTDPNLAAQHEVRMATQQAYLSAPLYVTHDGAPVLFGWRWEWAQRNPKFLRELTKAVVPLGEYLE